MIAAYIAISVLVSFSIVRHLKLKRIKKKVYLAEERERKMQAANQTMRLHELNQLRLRLEDTNKQTQKLSSSVERLDIVLRKIEELIETDQLALAETLLSRFSKHLRQLLHEGAKNRILIREAFEYLECALSLMAAMSKHSWGFEINKDNFAEFDSNRDVKSLTLLPWLFDQLWEPSLSGEIKTSVQLIISSNTYDVDVELRFNDESKLIIEELF